MLNQLIDAARFTSKTRAKSIWKGGRSSPIDKIVASNEQRALLRGSWRSQLPVGRTDLTWSSLPTGQRIVCSRTSLQSISLVTFSSAARIDPIFPPRLFWLRLLELNSELCRSSEGDAVARPLFLVPCDSLAGLIKAISDGLFIVLLEGKSSTASIVSTTISFLSTHGGDG